MIPVFKVPFSTLITKCHCGKDVLKVRIGDHIHTFCDVCYRDSTPDISNLTSEVINLLILELSPVEDNLLVKKLVEQLKVEATCRRLDRIGK